LEGPLRGNDGLLLSCNRYQEIILDSSDLVFPLITLLFGAMMKKIHEADKAAYRNGAPMICTGHG
jgi:hypothetical protein